MATLAQRFSFPLPNTWRVSLSQLASPEPQGGRSPEGPSSSGVGVSLLGCELAPEGAPEPSSSLCLSFLEAPSAPSRLAPVCWLPLIEVSECDCCNGPVGWPCSAWNCCCCCCCCCCFCTCLLPRRPLSVYLKPWKKLDFLKLDWCCCLPAWGASGRQLLPGSTPPLGAPVAEGEWPAQICSSQAALAVSKRSCWLLRASCSTSLLLLLHTKCCWHSVRTSSAWKPEVASWCRLISRAQSPFSLSASFPLLFHSPLTSTSASACSWPNSP